MRYSLVSRFRGTLLGAAIGENLGAQSEGPAYQPWGKLTVLGAKSLIRLGKFDLEDWYSFYRESPQGPECRVSTEAIIATLPVALFYHENEIKLRENLLSLTSIWQDEPVLRDGALAVGYAIAQSLTDRINPTHLIAQTIAFLAAPQSQLVRQMAQVQTLLEQGAGLDMALTHLGRDLSPSLPVALAFYCFLSTTDDLRLSVLRAAQVGYQARTTTALTGALSGAYNTIVGMPSNLRLAIFHSDIQLLETWGITREAEMLQLSDSLLAVWSGVYDWKTSSVAVKPLPAIAAPRTIRLR